MSKELTILDENNIRNKIYINRGFQVMLDEDLAELYGVETRRLNEQVKRNIERFPEKFMFQLTSSEYGFLMSQFATSNFQQGGRRKLPYAFTEQGIAMLSGVLKSEKAVNISIQIMNAFVAMRRFIASNGPIFQRVDTLERKSIEYDKKFELVFDAIESKELKSERGIFFDGQVFDAYVLISKLVKSAVKSIVLIDNYVDETVLALFSKRKKNVDVTIYTKNISRQLMLDVEKYNTQYPKITIIEFDNSHDRFMIVDDKIVYHFGASLKDLGRKWFAFSKFDKEAFRMMERLGKFK